MFKNRALKVTMIPDEPLKDIVIDPTKFEDKMVLVGASVNNAIQDLTKLVAVYILCDTCRKILIRRLG